MTLTSPQKRRRVRRHRAPAPLTDSAELFEGGEILRDFDGDIAVVLWKSYKNVMLWSGAGPEERDGLFAQAAGSRRRQDLRSVEAERPVKESLAAIAGMLEAPAATRPAQVHHACRQLSEWAAARDASATALLFMQAAALANPADAFAACAVGRMTRDRAEYARAETWFRQAIVAARQSADWSTYALSYLGLAKVYWQRGALPTARKCVHRAYRTATRHHNATLRGQALWQLGVFAAQASRWDEAGGCVRGALRILGAENPVSLRLVNDIAYAWINQGWFAPAARVLAAVAERAPERGERLYLNGSLARAAGGAGEHAPFERALATVRELSADPALAAIVPDGWLDVARGAASLRSWDLAESAAETSLRLATERGEARVRFEAEATLASIRAERAASRVMEAAAALPDSVSALAIEMSSLFLVEQERGAALVGGPAS